MLKSITDLRPNYYPTLCAGAAPQGARSAARVSIETGEFGDIIHRLWPNRASNPTSSLPISMTTAQCSLPLRLKRRATALPHLGFREVTNRRALDVVRSPGRQAEAKMVAHQQCGRSRKRSQAVSGSLDPVRRKRLLPITTRPTTRNQHRVILQLQRSAISTLPEPWRRRYLEHVANASDPGLKHWRTATEGDAL